MKLNHKELKSNTKGFVLLLTIFIMVMLATAIISLLTITAIDLNLITNHNCSLQAYYVAEAGIADAIDRIQEQGTPSTIEWDSYFPIGTLNTYHVSLVLGPTIVVTSTGTVPAANFSRKLEARVKVITDVAPYKVAVKHYEEVTL